jgi:hypothetical protein
MVIISLFTVSCRELPALEWTPELVKDTDYITIIGNTKSGNKGLLDFDGDVYIHLGLITSKSNHTNEWRYVKFKWGSREIAAKATPAGKNKWSYSITNIREFFGVSDDEKIISLGILFRSGACIDIHCKVLRNDDGTNMYIPIQDETVASVAWAQ